MPVYYSQSGPVHSESEELAAVRSIVSPGGEPVSANFFMGFSYSDSERTWDSGTSSKSGSWSAGQSFVLGASRCAGVLLEEAKAIWPGLDSAPVGQLIAEPCLVWDLEEVAHMLNIQRLEAPTGLYLYGHRPGEHCYLLYRWGNYATTRWIQQELSRSTAARTLPPEAVRECLRAWKRGSVRDRGGDALAHDPSSCNACGSALFPRAGGGYCPYCGPKLEFGAHLHIRHQGVPSRHCYTCGSPGSAREPGGEAHRHLSHVTTSTATLTSQRPRGQTLAVVTYLCMSMCLSHLPLWAVCSLARA